MKRFTKMVITAITAFTMAFVPVFGVLELKDVKADDDTVSLKELYGRGYNFGLVAEDVDINNDFQSNIAGDLVGGTGQFMKCDLTDKPGNFYIGSLKKGVTLKQGMAANIILGEEPVEWGKQNLIFANGSTINLDQARDENGKESTIKVNPEYINVKETVAGISSRVGKLPESSNTVLSQVVTRSDSRITIDTSKVNDKVVVVPLTADDLNRYTDNNEFKANVTVDNDQILVFRLDTTGRTRIDLKRYTLNGSQSGNKTRESCTAEDGRLLSGNNVIYDLGEYSGGVFLETTGTIVAKNAAVTIENTSTGRVYSKSFKNTNGELHFISDIDVESPDTRDTTDSTPEVSTAAPGTTTAAPEATTAAPEATTAAPEATTAAPGATTAAPEATTAAPGATTAAPEATTAAPEATTAAPEATTAAPGATTAAPRTTTAAPGATTAAPRTTTSAPRTTTSAPGRTTEAPAERSVSPAETKIPSDGQNGTLVVIIHDKNNNSKIPGAEIEITGTDGTTQKYTTDKDGTVTIKDTPAGGYSIKVVSVPDGYTAPDRQENVSVEAGSIAQKDVAVSKKASENETASPAGTPSSDTNDATDAPAGTPSSDTNDRTAAPAGTPSAGANDATAAPSGTPQTGQNTSAADSSTSSPGQTAAPSENPSSVTGTQTGSQTGNLVVVIRDRNTNRKIPGADVKVTGPDGKEYELTTDDNGTVTLSSVPAGEYSVRVTSVPDGYTAPKKVESISVTPGSTAEKEVTVSKRVSSGGSSDSDDEDEDSGSEDEDAASGSGSDVGTATDTRTNTGSSGGQPDTGDNTNLPLAAGSMFLSGVLLAAAVTVRIKNRSK